MVYQLSSHGPISNAAVQTYQSTVLGRRKNRVHLQDVRVLILLLNWCEISDSCSARPCSNLIVCIVLFNSLHFSLLRAGRGLEGFLDLKQLDLRVILLCQNLRVLVDRSWNHGLAVILLLRSAAVLGEHARPCLIHQQQLFAWLARTCAA